MVRILGVMMILLTACTSAAAQVTSTTVGPTSTTIPSALPTTRATTTTLLLTEATTSTPALAPSVDEYGRPAWLGTRILPIDDRGFGEVRPTPDELIRRAFGTVDLLAPPATADFASAVMPVPDDVLDRSTWTADCPVQPEDLAYVTVSHFGFDGRLHTGELIVNRSVADGIVDVFRLLWEAQYPIEEMRVVAAPELELPPTGDGNNTTAFVCRAATGGSQWSQHAYGLAIDINPFHNPYLKGDLVLPELATYYVDRELGGAGMIERDGAVTDAFQALGWGWGGNWSSLKDWMHFSQNGR